MFEKQQQIKNVTKCSAYLLGMEPVCKKPICRKMRSSMKNFFLQTRLWYCLKLGPVCRIAVSRYGNRTFRQRRFGKKSSRRFGKFFMPNRPVLSCLCFWFSTNWLVPPLLQYQFVFYNTSL